MVPCGLITVRLRRSVGTETGEISDFPAGTLCAPRKNLVPPLLRILALQTRHLPPAKTLFLPLFQPCVKSKISSKNRGVFFLCLKASAFKHYPFRGSLQRVRIAPSLEPQGRRSKAPPTLAAKRGPSGATFCGELG